MAEEAQKLSPPYVGYGSFTKFVASLGEHMPDRIDRSVFGGMSGGLAYGILSALKFLKLIDSDGRPAELLESLASAEGEERQAALRRMLKEGYPGLLDGALNLEKATSGQLDNYLRDTFSITGSTIDKAAVFVLATASAAGIQISPQLKARKPIAIGMSKKPRPKKSNGPPPADEPPPPPPHKTPVTSADPVAVLVSIIDMSAMDDDEQQAVWTLIRFLKRQEAEKKVTEADQ